MALDKRKLLFGRNVAPDLDLDDDDQFRAALRKAAPFQPDDVEPALFEIVADGRDHERGTHGSCSGGVG